MTASDGQAMKRGAGGELEQVFRRQLCDLIRVHGSIAAGVEVFDRRVEAMRTLDRHLRIAWYTAVSEALQLFDAEIYVTALRAAGGGDAATSLSAETRALILAVSKGLELGEWLETESAAAWLERHGGDDTVERPIA